MISILLIYILKLVILVVLLPFQGLGALLSLVMPEQVFTGVYFVLENVMVFNGLFPIADLFMAFAWFLTVLSAVWFVKLIFMGLNALPGVHLQLPEKSYAKETRITNTDGLQSVKTVHVIKHSSRRPTFFDK